MATNRRATMAKRQREQDQKDRVKEREARLADRQARTVARKANGDLDPGTGDPAVDDIRFDEEGRPIVARSEDGMPLA